jgi:probable HAF family extracellular repeat protein
MNSNTPFPNVMKSQPEILNRRFCRHLTAALLNVLFCVGFAGAQAVGGETQLDTKQAPPPAGFTYKALNYPGATYTEAFAINDSGEVVGTYGTAEQYQNGFTYSKGAYSTLNCVLENGTLLADINNKGEIVGSEAGNDNGDTLGFIWEGDGSCDPVTPNSLGTGNVWGVNDSGEVVGWYTNTSGNYESFLFADNNYTIINCPNAVSTRAYGIANNGDIVGDFIATAGGPFQGMIYKSGKCTTVNYPGAVWTSVKGMNSKGEISGWYTDSSGAFHGFVRIKGAYQPLNYPGAVTTLAFHLNDNGQVAGWYTDSSGGTHGFVAAPKTAVAAGGDAKTRGYSITSFTPASGAPGTTVTIYATGDLTQTYWLKFNGAYSDGIKVISNTEVTATVPSAATTGRISITLTDPSGEVLVSPSNFTVIP